MNQGQKIRAVLLGKDKTGKSCLLGSFSDKSFHASYLATIGMDFSNKTINDSGKTYDFQLWDTSGQERFHALSKSCCKGAHMFFIVYDITDKESFNSVPSFLSETNELSNFENKIIYLIGNKTDLESKRVVPTKDGENYAKDNKINFIEVSAKEPGAFGKIVLDAINKIKDYAAFFPQTEEE